MGFDGYDLRFLLSARQLGFKGRSICTLGHQTLFISQRQLSAILEQFGQEPISLPNRAILFADDVLVPLGFEVHSLDASSYEGATMLHDLNQPIPDELRERFDLVWDGGTLEHVFEFTTALHSAMRMVKVGGHLVMRTPANNQCGHGFYQFSPELFFRVFSPENGFELVRLYITGRGGPYHVVDPILVHGRVQLLSSEGALLMVHARKQSPTPDRLAAPQQSDYVTVWACHDDDKADGRLKTALRRMLSPDQVARVSKILNALRQKRAVLRWKWASRLSNRKLYVPVTRWDEPTSEATQRMAHGDH
jgi:hypothetical protein